MERVSASGDREAFRYPVGETWESVTWKEAGARVTRLAAGLVAAGIEPQQRVGIASGTRYEWILADLAIMCAGAATTTVYPSTMTEDVAYILADSECRVVFAEDDAQIAKLKEKRNELPQITKVVTFEGTADGDWIIGLDDLEKLGEELLNDNGSVVRPTFMGAAPRIFEKAHGRIVTMQKQEGGLKEKIFNAAFAVGLKVDQLKREGKSVPPLLKVQHALFDRLVFSKIRERFGGRVRFFISGAAALNRDVAEWFHAAGILILEGYGMTESSAGSVVNHPEDYKFGTVGIPMPGTEIKIAQDGEILIKGPGVMQGYHNMPEATEETVNDGWLHTGDIGEFDGDHLRITDRKKDLFKTSGGKYIAPSAIESQFKAICPLASQFLVHGNERNYCVALVALDPDALTDWAEHHGKGGTPYDELVKDPEVEKEVADCVEQLNARLNRWESIKKWIILDHDLTVESGELTPSMKVKRKVVEENYKQEIDKLYA